MLDKLKMLKQARDIQAKLKDITLSEEENKTKVTVSGDQQIIAIEVNPDMLTVENKQQLEKDLKSATNKALRQSQVQMASSMKSELGSLIG